MSEDTVWVVVQRVDYEGSEVAGVFSTENEAVTYARQQQKAEPDWSRVGWEVQEWAVGTPDTSRTWRRREPCGANLPYPRSEPEGL